MSDTLDIRVWAKENGYEVAPKGPVPKAVRAAWEVRETPPQEPPLDEPELIPESPEVRAYAETRPAVGKKTWWGGRKQVRDPKQPRAARPRVSIESLVTSAWGMGAMMLAKYPNALPTARVLDMQAPVAGVVVNDMAKGTVLDKVLQPIARAGQSGEKIMGLIGPPLLTSAIAANPQLFPVLKPVLKMSLMSWLEISEPAMRKVQARAKKFEEKFGTIDIDEMIEALFAPPPGSPWAAAASPEEEEAIRRAREEY